MFLTVAMRSGRHDVEEFDLAAAGIAYIDAAFDAFPAPAAKRCRNGHTLAGPCSCSPRWVGQVVRLLQATADARARKLGAASTRRRIANCAAITIFRVSIGTGARNSAERQWLQNSNCFVFSSSDDDDAEGSS